MLRRLLPVAIAVVLIAGGCSYSDDAIVEETATKTTVQTTPTLTLTAASTTLASPLIVASFDGETCLYDGPEHVTSTQPLTISFTNESDMQAGLFVSSFRDDDLEELLSLIGKDIEPSVLPGGTPTIIGAELLVGPGETTMQHVLLGPGTWIVDCQTRQPNMHGPAHLWPVGVVEIQ